MLLEKCAIGIFIVKGQLPSGVRCRRTDSGVEDPDVVICTYGLVPCGQRVKKTFNKIRPKSNIPIVKN